MKVRSTFVHDAEDNFDPSQLKAEGNSLSLRGLKAAREDRFTFSFQELPQEVRKLQD